LTNQGYDKAMNWFEENLPEEGIPTTPPSTQLTDLQISILEAVKEVSAIKGGDGFARINEIWPYNMGMMPINYDVFTQDVTTPSLQKDLAFMYAEGYLEFSRAGIGVKDYTYRLSQKGIDFLNDLKSQATPASTQPTSTPAQLEEEPTQGLNYRRPSPTFSATKYATGVTMFGNDMSLWRVTENKNGVKRWVKVGEPTPAIEEPPISEIEEDEVDLDILEQQLNDDSLEFDISDEDLENLEF
jgi:hypothetical protein